MEYDFSKIKTEDLRKQVNSYEKNKTLCIGYFSCSDCPMYKKDAGCNPDNGEERYKLFKEELIRREKMENKMPTIVSGMIVELECGDVAIALPNKENVSLYYKSGRDVSDYNVDIKRIYLKKDGRHYGGFFSKDFLENLDISEAYNLIWSKKSDKDIKIEELEKELQHLEEDHSKKVSEIRDRLQELKG